MQDNTEFGLTEVQAERVMITLRYRRLHQEAYGYPARQVQIDLALAVYRETLTDVTLALEELADHSDGLREECEFADIPAWMTAGAPDPQTYRRWLTTGRI